MRSTAILLFFCLSVHFIYPQCGDYHAGSRAMGLGYASITVEDEWTGFNGIGSLAWNKDPSVAFAFRNFFGMDDLQVITTSLNIPQGNWAGTLNFYRFGDTFFNENRVSAGLGHRIGKYSLGSSVNYLQYSAENHGSAGTFYVDFGGRAELLTGWLVGAWVQNITKSGLNKNNRIPLVVRLGISWRPGNNIMWNLDLEKMDHEQMVLKSGLEYVINKKLFLRTGINWNPVQQFFGIGFRPGRFHIDYGLAIHPYLGLSHQVSLSCRLKK